MPGRSIAAGVALFGETLQPAFWVALAFPVAGLILVNRRPRRAA